MIKRLMGLLILFIALFPIPAGVQAIVNETGSLINEFASAFVPFVVAFALVIVGGVAWFVAWYLTFVYDDLVRRMLLLRTRRLTAA